MTNTIIFEVTDGWIHYIEPMKVTRNENGTFDVKFYIAWNHNHDVATEYHYENISKDEIFELVTGPTYTKNRTDYYCFCVDKEKLKDFIGGK